jgi:hypothetical protein
VLRRVGVEVGSLGLLLHDVCYPQGTNFPNIIIACLFLSMYEIVSIQEKPERRMEKFLSANS